MIRFLCALALCLLTLPVFAQRANLDTGWTPSTPFGEASDVVAMPFYVPLATDPCATAELALVSQYAHTCRFRNLTSEPLRIEGSWLTFLELGHAPDVSLATAVVAFGHGSSFGSHALVMLAPNDGEPGGPDEQTLTVTLTQNLAELGDAWLYHVDAAPFAEVAGERRGAHRMWFRAEHWWTITYVNGAPLAPGHWPFAVDVLDARARAFGRVTFQ